MFKLAITAAVTAAACFAIVAATGLGASSANGYLLKKGDVTLFKTGNLRCQVLTATQVACGPNKSSLANTIQVYFAPNAVAVLRFDKTGKKFQQLYAVKR